MKKLILFSFSLIFIYSSSYSQKSEYTDKCEIVRDLLDTAGQTFFDFSRESKDSTITILDINGLFKKCPLTSIAGIKIIIIDSGAELRRIRKEGIFSASTRRNDFFVFTMERLDSLTVFRIYHPRSNSQCYWAFIEKNKHYYFRKKSFGSF